MLRQEIERIRNIPDITGLNEKTVQTAIILPILRALDWDTANPHEVILEHAVGKHMKGNVDIALMSPNKPVAFIEAKSASTSIQSDLKLRNQLLDYCLVADLNVGILTNGLIWEFYYLHPSEKSGSEEYPPPITVVDFIENNISDVIHNLQKYLSRDSLYDASASESLRQAHISNHIQSAWNNLLKRGDSKLAGALRKETDSKVVKLKVAESEQYIRDQFQRYQKNDVIVRHLESTESAPTDSTKIDSDVTGEQKEVKPTKTVSLSPRYIVAFQQRREVSTWKDVKVQFLTVLVEQYPELLNGKLFEIYSVKGKEYVVQSHDLDRRKFAVPAKIGPNDAWTETHGGGKAVLNQCQAILQKVELSEDMLAVFDENDARIKFD